MVMRGDHMRLRTTPMMTKNEVTIINGIFEMLEPSTVLEWGAGGSTLYWPNKYAFIEEWNCIEHSKEWFWRLVSLVGSNVTLARVRFPHYWGNPRLVDGFVRDVMYDLILIDGRQRVKCLDTARYIVASDGVVLLHDASRPRYQVGFEYYQDHVVLTQGTMDDRSKHGPWRRGLAAFGSHETIESIRHRFVQNRD